MFKKDIIDLLKRSNVPVAVIVPVGYNGILFSRALSKENVPVIGIFSSDKECFYHTNSCKKIIVEDIQKDSFIELLVELGKLAKTKPVLISVSDLEVLLFSKHRTRLEQYFLMNIPDRKMIDILMDKTEFYKWGHEKFSFPKTILVKSDSDFEKALDGIDYPIIFKPKYRNSQWLKLHLPKANIFNNRQETTDFYNKAKEVEKHFVISEFIPGGDDHVETCHVYYRNGELLATYVDQKIRQNPPITGTGTFISSCANDFIKNETIQIFNQMKFTGIGGMEYKKDSRTGKYKIIEPFSGRPSSHFYTGLGEGINLPYLVYCDIIGKEIPNYNQDFNKVVSQLDEEPDLRSALYYIIKKELSLADYLKSLKTTRLFVRFSLRDPLVGIVFCFRLLCLVIKKANWGFK